MSEQAYVNPPNALERFLTRLFGRALHFGLGLPHHFLLEVRGRKSGRIYQTPVNVLNMGSRRYLVGPRGSTQWVRNARANGGLVLRKGNRQEELSIRELRDEEKPEVLKVYLDRFRLEVQRYFPVRAGSPAEDLTPLASRYPVFELTHRE